MIPEPAAPRRRVGYREIVQLIQSDIALGRRRAGDRLPPVRALAESLGVNINTVARAYGELARDGTILANRGGGSYVADPAGNSVMVERRAVELRSILSDAVLRALSLGHDPAEIEREVGIQIQRWSCGASSLGRTDQDTSSTTVLFSGSNDLALELLVDRLSQPPHSTTIQLDFTGSTAGLMALRLGEADFAGCHLGSGDDAVSEVHRILPGRDLLLVNLARRQQGLIVPRGNPRGFRDITDILATGVVPAMRQPGSGTRILQERLLREKGHVVPEQGGPVFQTHTQIAAAIAQGSADVGLGILAAARTYGLDFVPVGWETYTLVFLAEMESRQWVRAILEALRSDQFRQIILSLGGYDTAHAGTCLRVAGA